MAVKPGSSRTNDVIMGYLTTILSINGQAGLMETLSCLRNEEARHRFAAEFGLEYQEPELPAPPMRLPHESVAGTAVQAGFDFGGQI